MVDVTVNKITITTRDVSFSTRCFLSLAEAWQEFAYRELYLHLPWWGLQLFLRIISDRRSVEKIREDESGDKEEIGDDTISEVRKTPSYRHAHDPKTS